MSNIFAGIEALDKQIAEDRIDLSELLFNIIDDETAINEMNAEITSIEVAEERFDIAFEQLKALHKSISEFGISKSVILAVDPDGYLEKNGLIPSYESLNDLPTKDENAEIALESLSDIFKKYWNKVIKITKETWKKMKGMLSRIENMLNAYQIVIAKNKEAIKNKKFNDDKVKEKKIKVITFDEFYSAKDYFEVLVKRMFGSLETNVDSLLSDIQKYPSESIKDAAIDSYKTLIEHNNDHIKFIGMKIELNNGKVTWKHVGGSIFDKIKEGTLIDRGYKNINAIDRILQDTTNLIKDNKKINDHIKEIDKIQDEFEKAVNVLISKVRDDKNKKYANDLDKSLKIMKTSLDFIKISYIKMSNIAIKLVKTAIIVGSAAKVVSE